MLFVTLISSFTVIPIPVSVGRWLINGARARACVCVCVLLSQSVLLILVNFSVTKFTQSVSQSILTWEEMAGHYYVLLSVTIYTHTYTHTHTHTQIQFPYIEFWTLPTSQAIYLSISIYMLVFFNKCNYLFIYLSLCIVRFFILFNIIYVCCLNVQYHVYIGIHYYYLTSYPLAE